MKRSGCNCCEPATDFFVVRHNSCSFLSLQQRSLQTSVSIWWLPKKWSLLLQLVTSTGNQWHFSKQLMPHRTFVSSSCVQVSTQVNCYKMSSLAPRSKPSQQMPPLATDNTSVQLRSGIDSSELFKKRAPLHWEASLPNKRLPWQQTTLQQRANASQGHCVVQLRSGIDSSELFKKCALLHWEASLPNKRLP